MSLNFRSFLLGLVLCVAGCWLPTAATAQQMPAWNSDQAYIFFTRHLAGATEERKLSSGPDAEALDRYIAAINKYLEARDAKNPGAAPAYQELLQTANAVLMLPPQAYPDAGGTPRPVTFQLNTGGATGALSVQGGSWAANLNGAEMRGFLEKYNEAINASPTGSRGPFPLARNIALKYEGDSRLPWLHLSGPENLHMTTLNTFRLMNRVASTIQTAARNNPTPATGEVSRGTAPAARNPNAQGLRASAPVPTQTVSVQPAAPRMSVADKIFTGIAILAMVSSRYQASQQAWQSRWAQPVIYSSANNQSKEIHLQQIGHGNNYSDGHGRNFQIPSGNPSTISDSNGQTYQRSGSGYVSR